MQMLRMKPRESRVSVGALVVKEPLKASGSLMSDEASFCSWCAIWILLPGEDEGSFENPPRRGIVFFVIEPYLVLEE